MSFMMILASAGGAAGEIARFARALADEARVCADVAACAATAKASRPLAILAPVGEVAALRLDDACADLAIIAYAYPRAGAETEELWAQIAVSLADEALVAPFGEAEFVARCRRAIRRRAPREGGERRRRDRLTGVLTRLGLTIETPRLDAMAQAGPVVVFRARLVGLSRVNASFGAFVGDAVLKAAATRLVERAAPGALVARLAGDDFALIEFGAQALAPARARALGDALEAPYQIAGDDIFVETKLSRAVGPEQGASVDQLIENAAKSDVDAIPRPPASAAPASPGIASPPSAVAATFAQLDVHYQPQVSLVTGRTIGGEALLRARAGAPAADARTNVAAAVIEWTRDEAFRTRLNEWVLRRCGADIAAWSDVADPTSRLSVTVGAEEVLDGSLARLCGALAQARALDATRIDLKAPAAVLTSRDAPARLDALARLGVSVTLDVSALDPPSDARLDGVARLKLDRAVLGEPRGRAWLALARSSGLRALAARMESAAHVALAREAGCAEAQGYHFAAPAPLSELLGRAA